MKTIISAAIALLLATSVHADWQGDYTSLLQTYVKGGGVDYLSWSKNSTDTAKLKNIVDTIGKETPTGGKSDKLAFYINAYNAWTLYYFVKDHPRQHSNAFKRAIFFKSDNIKVAGKSMSLESLENDIIRARFNEPRIHFALNCASASCPPLLNRAYLGATLDADLTGQTRGYVNENPLGVKVSKNGETATISEIFKWFAADFGDDPKSFINQYRDSPLGASTKIEYQSYDWSRNDPK